MPSQGTHRVTWYRASLSHTFQHKLRYPTNRATRQSPVHLDIRAADNELVNFFWPQFSARPKPPLRKKPYEYSVIVLDRTADHESCVCVYYVCNIHVRSTEARYLYRTHYWQCMQYVVCCLISSCVCDFEMGKWYLIQMTFCLQFRISEFSWTVAGHFRRYIV